MKIFKLHPTNFIPLLAVPAALVLPKIGVALSPYTTWILAALLFSSFAGIKFGEMATVVRHPARSMFTVLMILVVAPLAIYPIAQFLFPEFALGALLFMMLPAAVSSPAVAAIYGGNVAVATVDAVLSNLLSVLTIPLLFGLFAHESVDIGTASILRQMLFVIVLPFAVGALINRFFSNGAKALHRHNRIINLSLLFFLFYAAFSPYIGVMLESLTNLHLILALIMTHAILHVLAKIATLGSKDEGEKVGILCNMILPNVGLGVVLAQHYLGAPEMIFILLSEIVWVVVVGLIHYVK